MIDVRNEVFDTFAQMMEAQVPGIAIDSTYTAYIAQFPYCSLQQTGSYNAPRTSTSGNAENVAAINFQLDVYSNSDTSAQEEAWEIAGIADEILQSTIGLRRISCDPVANINDATVYRIVIRYSCYVDKNKIVYRR